MDIERMKKLLNRKIEVGKKVNEVREVIKNYNKEKRDMSDYTEEVFKPTIKAQKDIKEAIDDKQNKVISKLQQNNNKQDEIITNIQENQMALKKGLSDLLEPYQREIIFRDELPKMIEDKGSDKDIIQLGDDDQEKKSPYKSNIDKGFTNDEIKILISHDLAPPSEVFKSYYENEIDIKDYEKDTGEIIKELGRQKGVLSNSKKRKAQNKKEIDELSEEIGVLQKYKKRISFIEEGSKTLGDGIYTQKKRNAYKISQRGQYGGLVIDLPKLYGHLKVVAHKNGKKSV